LNLHPKNRQSLPKICAREGNLENDHGLKQDEHPQGKEGIVPVLIQQPQPNTKDLKHEKGGHCVLFEEVSESGQRDFKANEVVPMRMRTEWQRRLST